MYNPYFGFPEEPFGITPDPRFFYENPIYREAYTTLAWGIRARRGLLSLVGAVGTGKTTILRHLMAKSEPSIRSVLVDYPPQSFDELLAFTCRELGLGVSEQGRLERIAALKEGLLASHAKNETTVLFLDEAQHLSEETLESVRLLSNLETAGEKLLQIVLVGQPELRVKLDRPQLRPLKQRITLEGRLDRLKYDEIAAYIEYRLSAAGYRGPELFGPDAVEAIGFYSDAVPRLINVICGNALLAAHRASRRKVSADLVVEVARALRLGPAVDYAVSRPVSPEPSSVSETPPAPDRIQGEPAGTRSRGAPYQAVAVAAESRRQFRRPVRRAAKRRWLWTSFASLAGVLLVAVGLALWLADDSAVVSLHGLAALRPATVRPGGGEVERGGSPDTTGARPPGRTSSPSRTATSEDAPATAELAGPPAPGAAAGQEAGARETRAVAGGEEVAVRAGPPVRSAWSAEDATARGQATPRPGRPTEAVVLRHGATISEIAWSAYGPRMFLALDLLKELNPHIDDLNWVLAGQLLRLPGLGRDDLIRAQADGSHRLILGSFPNAADAGKLQDTVRAHGYEPVVTRRQVSNDLVLHRVEIGGLRDLGAAHRTWETAIAAAWLARPTPEADGTCCPRP